MTSSLPARAAPVAALPTPDARLVSYLAADRPRIILGSASSARRAIMDQLAAALRIEYEVRTADIDEKAIRDPDPHTLVLKLARAKAAAVASKLRQERDEAAAAAAAAPLAGLLITCDQVVCHEGRVLEKPGSSEEAVAFIDGYGRSPASTVGATVVTDLATGRSAEGVDVATIHFSPIPAAVRDQLVDEGEVMWCAGGLMVEHPLVVPHIVRMEGGQDAVMGLAQATVLRLLLEAAFGGPSGVV